MSPSPMNLSNLSNCNGDIYFEPSFTEEITSRMQVPKRIKIGNNGATASDDYDDIPSTPWQPDKIDMRVPDRILVAGQDQHIGTSAPPREVIVENTIMPPDPGLIRVQTPPRVLTLDDHYFPSAWDDFYEAKEKIKAAANSIMDDTIMEDANGSIHVTQNPSQNMTTTSMVGNGQYVTVEDEVVHLRRQLMKLNRRVMNVEREIGQSRQRDKILLGVAAFYLIMKYMWANRLP